MTKVIFNLYEDAPNEIVPTNGRVIFSPSHVRKSDGKLITMNSFTMYAIDGGLSVELDPSPTPGHWAWNIEIIVPGNETVSGLYVVPFGEDVLFTDLVELDPESLEPTLDPEPAWWAMALSTVRGGYVSASGYLILTHTDGAETNAGNVKGEPGEDGDDGDDGTNGTNGDDGADGVSVQDTELDPQGNLILTFSNGFVDNVGRVKGEPGNDGKDGDGVHSITPLHADELLSAYPTGISVFNTTNQELGYPIGYATVTTVKDPTTGRGFQFAAAGSTSVEQVIYLRYSDSANNALGAFHLLGIDLSSEVSANGSAISALETSVSSNTTDIDTNAGNIAAHTADISANTTDISANAGNIAAHTADISANTTDISANAGNIATNSSDISSAESEISALTASVATNTGDIGILQTTTGDNTGDIATINDALPSFQGNAGEWVNVTPEPNYPAQGTYNPQTRRLGDGSIQFWGGFDISALPINKSTIIGTVNAAHVPVDNAYFIAYTNKGYASIRIGADGAISCTIPAAAGYVIIEQVMAGK